MLHTIVLASPSDTVSQSESLFRDANYHGAAKLLAPLATADPPHPTALRLLGLCRLRLNDPAEALRLLQQAHALQPDDPWASLHLGLGLHANGRHAEAAALLRAAATALPADPAPLLNLSSALLAMGDAPAALQAASDACFLAPTMAEAHYTYGLAWLAHDDAEHAGQAFAAAIQCAPKFADAWINLGLARYRAGDMAGAVTAMRAALSAAPDHRGATGNLGGFLRLSGDVEGAERLLQDLIRRDPDAAEARVNLAAGLLMEERAAEALEALQAPLPTEQRLRAHWQLQRALALLQLGRREEARAILDTLADAPQALAPLLLWRRVLLSVADGNEAAARAQADALEAMLDAAPSAVAEHRIMACYDLAKFWSRQGLPDRAFPLWVKGHQQLARFQPFAREPYRAFVDASIEAFSFTRMHSGPRDATADQAPVFVVGMPRSGTTLCEQILAAHRDVHAAGERPHLRHAFERLAEASSDTAASARRVAGLDAATLDHAGAAYVAELRALAPDAARIVDKMPGNYAYLGLVGLMLPGARVIHCVRDPRDIGFSIFTFRFYGQHPYAHDLADLGWYIGQHDRMMAHWRAALPNSILQVALTDWVTDFAGTLGRVLDFLGLPHDPACERFHEADNLVRTVSRAQVRQPVNARGLGRWQPYAQHLGPLLDELRRAGCLEGA